MYLQNNDQKYWFDYLEDDKLVYFQYNSCLEMKGKSFLSFNKELSQFIENNHVE